ncbi:hypothetical protein WJX84_010450 [Apatococcus fuscideae]|uniref:Uncharacterized protein n=1 Tax=Apatococcus fuscideae TaxID=2026836 RepID=A0AAW1SE48_9CHLO
MEQLVNYRDSQAPFNSTLQPSDSLSVKRRASQTVGTIKRLTQVRTALGAMIPKPKKRKASSKEAEELAAEQLSGAIAAAVQRTYLNCADLLLRHTWTVSALAYSYSLEPVCLRPAVQKLAEAYPTLTGRFQRDERGTYFIDGSDSGFSFTCARDDQSCISDLLSAFTLPSSSAPLPINSWATEFVDELQPDQYLNGDAPIFSLRLTLVRDGAILSFSYSHALADAEAVGQLACDLAKLSVGSSISPRQPSRMNLHRIGRTAAGLAAGGSDDELIATLPQYKTMPTSFQEWTDRECMISLGSHQMSAAEGPSSLMKPCMYQVQLERASCDGSSMRQHQLLFHPLVTWVGEVAAGNNLGTALRMPFNYIVDQRRLSSLADMDAAPAIPQDHFGNAVQIQVTMPPPFPELAPSNGDQHSAEDSRLTAAHVQNVFAAAACAIHKATQALRSDPTAAATAQAGLLGRMELGWWKGLRDMPGFNPMRDCATLLSGWRKTSTEKADFGQGKPWVVAGKTVPLKHKMAFLTDGPGGDAVRVQVSEFSILSYTKSTWSILQQIPQDGILY